jgi:chaperonin cofactor prefoldin
METLWDTIHRELTDNGFLSTYKVDVKELTNHLEQLYSEIEELKSEIRQLKGDTF